MAGRSRSCLSCPPEAEENGWIEDRDCEGAKLVRVWCDSAVCIEGSSLCDFFELLNRKGDLGDFGDFGLNGDLGESMKSGSSSTTEGSGSVSGCGVVFRVMMPLFVCSWGFFRLAAPQVAGLLMSRVHSLQVPELCHNSGGEALTFDSCGTCERFPRRGEGDAMPWGEVGWSQAGLLPSSEQID
jgi:hypothetical protein